MVIKDSDGTVIRTSVYPNGARVVSVSEVNYSPEETESEIVLKVCSRIGERNDFNYFQKRIQLLKGQRPEFEALSNNFHINKELFDI